MHRIDSHSSHQRSKPSPGPRVCDPQQLRNAQRAKTVSKPTSVTGCCGSKTRGPNALASVRFALTAFLAIASFTLSAAPAQREAWTTSRIIDSPEPPPPYTVERRFPNLEFKNPVEFVAEPGSDRWWMVELDGKVWTFKNDNGVTTRELAIDLKHAIGPKTRAYGLAFHPDYETNRQIYLCYITDQKQENGTHVSEFRVDKAPPPVVDSKSERILIRWRSGGHNGGSLKFGPDGFLYISTGDSEVPSPPDPLNTGQDVSDLLASILRIDVDRAEGGLNYAVPRDNPFIGVGDARPEIWAFGFRNPWRMSFDRKTGELWVGDVGWELWEMVFRIERGGNYGWSIMEGSQQTVKPDNPRGPAPISPPIAEHPHTEAMSVTGGFVYHGDRLPGLKGAYLYGDYVTGKMWALRARQGVRKSLEEIATTNLRVICFGEGHDGEIYAVDYNGGIHRFVENQANDASAAFPRKLSETGLFASTRNQTPAKGVIPYYINVEPWSDHATGNRFVAIPDLGRLGVHKQNNPGIGIIRGKWSFPTNSVVAKTVLLEMERGNPDSSRRLETQVLHFDGLNWNPYNYIWNDDQTDATLSGPEASERVFEIADKSAPNGKRKQTWHFASRAECMLCHTPRGGVIYGFTPEQLDGIHGSGNDLDRLSALGLFKQPVNRKKLKRMPAPHDSSATLESRARAYLHVNCSHCHMRGGGGTAVFDVRHPLTTDKTLLIDTPPSQGAFGIEDARIVAPGRPFHSTLPYRMAKLGSGRMPHFGSNLVDQEGVRLMLDWISAMPAPEFTKAQPWNWDQFERMLQTLPDGPKAARNAAIDQHLSDTANALRLARAVQEPAFAAQLKQELIARAATHPKPETRDLFERFLPEDQRAKRLGTSFDPSVVLSKQGDASRGRQVFFRESVQCINCHRLENRGRELGPDLSKIGAKYPRAQLLKHLTEPSKFIDPKFIAYEIETKDDESLSGFIVKRTEKALTLKTVNAETVTIKRGDYVSIRPSTISTMPFGILQSLTTQEAADLLTFLGTLK